MMMLSVPFLVHAQQQPMYGQYIINNSVLNPAQAGADNTSHWGILMRNQWTGIEGAPRTESAYMNLRIPGDLGLAIGMYQDRHGPEINLNLQTDLAFHTRISRNLAMAGGLRLNMSQLRVDLSKIPDVDPRNPYFSTNLSSGLHLNAGAGVLIYSPQAFAGLSLPRAFSNQVTVIEPDVVDFQKREVRHIFVYGGMNLYPTDETTFTPSVLIKFSEDGPTQIDLNGIFGFENMLDFGPLLRINVVNSSNWFDAVGFMAGLRFWEQWYFGYVYEHPLSGIQMASRQTHEISLRFFWNPPDRERLSAPRYFQ